MKKLLLIIIMLILMLMGLMFGFKCLKAYQADQARQKLIEEQQRIVKEIASVIEQYVQLLNKVNKESGVLDYAWNQSTMVGKIVDGLRAIDTSGCPDDFRSAFSSFAEAWEQYRKTADKYGGMKGLLKGFSLRGKAAGLAISSGTAEAGADFDEITRVGRQVDECARRHGVNVE